MLFKCDWYDVSHEEIGYKRDWHETTIVNTLWKLKTVESFVLTCQATQVHYVNGIKDPTWNVVIETKPRNLYEMTSDEEEPYQEKENLHCNANVLQEEIEDDDIDWSRSGVKNMIIEWLQRLIASIPSLYLASSRLVICVHNTNDAYWNRDLVTDKVRGVISLALFC